jgi:dipeptidyl-peptidase-4
MVMKIIFKVLFIALFSQQAVAQNLTVERIWRNYEFSAKGASAYQMLNDGVHFVEWSNEGALIKGDISNNTLKAEVLISKSALIWEDKPIEVAGFEFNANEQKVLLWTAPKAIYRRSFEAFYFLYDLNTKKLEALDADHAPQTLAEYSPDGSKVSFIHGNDIFIKDLSSGKVSKVTADGKRNKIINGTTDWVYEEEFAITKAYGWSPDSKYLAFLKFDEREVPEFQMAMYGELYPEQYKYKYPKAGELNSKVTLNMLDVKSAKIQKIDLGAYEYIPRLKWSAQSNQLVVQTMNRHQNELNYWLIDATQKTVASKKFFTETSATYVDVDNNLLLLQDGKSILRTSEMSGFNHIYRLGFDGSSKAITAGSWDVIEFIGIDEQFIMRVRSQVLFTSQFTVFNLTVRKRRTSLQNSVITMQNS